MLRVRGRTDRIWLEENSPAERPVGRRTAAQGSVQAHRWSTSAHHASADYRSARSVAANGTLAPRANPDAASRLKTNRKPFLRANRGAASQQKPNRTFFRQENLDAARAGATTWNVGRTDLPARYRY